MIAAVAKEVSSASISLSHSQPLDLAVKNLCKSFSDSEKVLDNITFEVERGQAVALIGSSSSGKSTLLRCCARMIDPDSGSVSIFGEDTSNFSKTRLKKTQAKVGFIAADTALNPKQSAVRAVLEGAAPRKGRAMLWLQSSLLKSEREFAMSCLDSFGAGHIAQKNCADLSPLDRKKVCMARLLMQKPQLLVADEPVADLDVRSSELAMDLFVGVIKSLGLSLIFSSHNLVDALSYADRALALHMGRLELDAPVGAEDARILKSMYT